MRDKSFRLVRESPAMRILRQTTVRHQFMMRMDAQRSDLQCKIRTKGWLLLSNTGMVSIRYLNLMVWCEIYTIPTFGVAYRGNPRSERVKTVSMQQTVLHFSVPRFSQSRAQRSASGQVAKFLSAARSLRTTIASSMPLQATRAGHGSGINCFCSFQLITSSWTPCPPRKTPMTPPHTRLSPPRHPVNVRRTKNRPPWSHLSRWWSVSITTTSRASWEGGSRGRGVFEACDVAVGKESRRRGHRNIEPHRRQLET